MMEARFIGLPDSVTVAHVVLVHSVEVRILVGQPGGGFEGSGKVEANGGGF